MSVSPEQVLELVSKLPERHQTIVFRSAYDEYIEAHNCIVTASFSEDYYLYIQIESENEGMIEWVVYVQDIEAIKISDYQYIVSIDDMEMDLRPYGDLWTQ